MHAFYLLKIDITEKTKHKLRLIPLWCLLMHTQQPYTFTTNPNTVRNSLNDFSSGRVDNFMDVVYWDKCFASTNALSSEWKQAARFDHTKCVDRNRTAATHMHNAHAVRSKGNKHTVRRVLYRISSMVLAKMSRLSMVASHAISNISLWMKRVRFNRVFRAPLCGCFEWMHEQCECSINRKYGTTIAFSSLTGTCRMAVSIHGVLFDRLALAHAYIDDSVRCKMPYINYDVNRPKVFSSTLNRSPNGCLLHRCEAHKMPHWIFVQILGILASKFILHCVLFAP